MIADITEQQKQKVRAALLDSGRDLCAGLGTYDGERCTIAEINMALTGRLTDGLHPCMSNVIRRWVMRVQDSMPADVRNSQQWREAAVGIAGSAAARDVEHRRVAMLMEWMWDALADEAVTSAIVEAAKPEWDRMITKRSLGAAERASRAFAHAAERASRAFAHAAETSYTVEAEAASRAADAADCAMSDDAAEAAYNAAAAVDVVADLADLAADYAAFWERRDCPGMLARLVGA